jgi:hypothetical protein
MTTRTFRIFYALRSAAFPLGETIMQTAEQLDVYAEDYLGTRHINPPRQSAYGYFLQLDNSGRTTSSVGAD